MKMFTVYILIFSLMRESMAGDQPILNRPVSKETTQGDHCYRASKCEPLSSTECLGAVLTYSHTSVDLANDSTTQKEVNENLSLWLGLQNVPRCWAVVQPFLCAVYKPKCENDRVVLPTQEMCKVTRSVCKIVEVEYGWPNFLHCDIEQNFPSGCRNVLQEVKFNTSAQCVHPLVETDNPSNWYEGVEGCGVQCQNPLYTPEEHSFIHNFIAVSAGICLFFNFFTVVTFLIDWKSANKYPSLIIFYINGCFMIACIGWLAQFIPGVRENLVCRHDGTMKHGQPSSTENLSCVIIFILIYYFLVAALIWFVILAYAWHALFHQTGVPREVVESKSAYFHLVAWSLPLMLTIAIMAVAEVDGDSVTGICFVGYANIAMRITFLLAPLLLALLTGGFFLIKGIVTLVKVKVGSEDVASAHATIRIRQMIFRIGAFTFLAFVFGTTTITCHIYDYTYRKEWESSFRDYLICSAKATVDQSAHKAFGPCQLKSRPNFTVIQVHLLSLFAAGIVMSSWVWTSATLNSWKRFLNRLSNRAVDEPVKLKRHKMIAQAFARRQEINQGHLSLSFHSTHEDPVGMNLELNSVASQEMSSTWAAALPKFVTRRGALVGTGPLGIRRYSSASDISQQRFSVDSYAGRRQSLDSQLSLHLSEQEFLAHVLSRHQRRKTRKERERLFRAHNRIVPWFPGSRRGSDTSQQSAAIAASLAAAGGLSGVKAKITKSTSTGDLNEGPLFNRPPSKFLISRPLVQRQGLLNPPFTHGMTDNSHQQNNVTKKSQPEIEAPEGSNHVFQPTNFSSYGMMSGLPHQLPSLGHSLHPVFQQGYDFMASPIAYLNGVSLPGQVGGAIPNYLGNASLSGGMGYNSCGGLPYGMIYGSYPSSIIQAHQPLIPLHPTIDSSSDAEFLPIILSDSEFTDVGHRSYDEAQLLSAHRLMQEHAQQMAALSNCIMPFPREQQQQPVVQSPPSSCGVSKPHSQQQNSRQESSTHIEQGRAGASVQESACSGLQDTANSALSVSQVQSRASFKKESIERTSQQQGHRSSVISRGSQKTGEEIEMMERTSRARSSIKSGQRSGASSANQGKRASRFSNCSSGMHIIDSLQKRESIPASGETRDHISR